MKAARLHALGADTVVEEIPLPQPGPGQVRARIAVEGASPSDLHIRSGEVPGVALPHTLGREDTGWVDAFGPGAENQSSLSVRPLLFSVGGAVEEEMRGVAREGQLITCTERFPLTSFKGVFSRLARRETLRRAVVVPCDNSVGLPT